MNTTEIRQRPPAQVPVRMLATGVNAWDLERLTMKTEKNGEDWVKACEELGDYDFALAEAELKKGHRLTAYYFYIAAESLYRIGQYGIDDITEEKLHLNQRLTDSFARAAALCDPPLEKVSVPYHGYNMDGWMYMPKNAPRPCPVVIMIPGATGFKEEMHLYVMQMVERGLAVLSVDGPGQGVTRYVNGGTLEVETEKPHGAMIDFLKKDPRFGKIAIYGSSTGGYYVARTAAFDHRLAACVIQGGAYYTIEMINFNPHYKHHFAVLFGKDDDTTMNELMPKMTLEGIAEKIECPLLIIHGENDYLFSLKGQQRLYDEARSSDKTIKVYPMATHGAQERASEVYRLAADWLADHLLK